MATKSNYLVKINPLVNTQDLPNLPEQLQEEFSVYQLVLAKNPYQPRGVPSHDLDGRLNGYRTLDINWDGIAYRLVYRIYESPTPKRVFIISFEEHDPAYDKAKERTGRAR
ncbi:MULTISPECIES: hypothetical protein [Kamptonema]|uniref:hypothetical protein n=1 Tax=Kamptonema TaxID=1501433 RepID=UPI0001DAC7A6|nr:MULTISPECIES: hypothetical protein [Kamptonema]CBN53821.1 conserved hypothetical protein [Kamptonema sp. PCC 6506]